MRGRRLSRAGANGIQNPQNKKSRALSAPQVDEATFLLLDDAFVIAAFEY